MINQQSKNKQKSTIFEFLLQTYKKIKKFSRLANLLETKNCLLQVERNVEFQNSMVSTG